MNDKLLCPFCQQELDCMGKYTDGSSKWLCNKCGLFGDKKLFDEIIRTRKALDKAKWWLNEIVESHRYTPISTAEMALKEITAILENKNGKKDRY